MGFSETLTQIHNAISQQSSDIDHKISRLKQAKREIENEQNACMGESRKIENPDLGVEWMGNRAQSFNESRKEAYNALSNIYNYEYDWYKQRIDGKITSLSMERGLLDIASGIAREADDLLEQGEEAVEALGEKISDLKARVF